MLCLIKQLPCGGPQVVFASVVSEAISLQVHVSRIAQAWILSREFLIQDPQ